MTAPESASKHLITTEVSDAAATRRGVTILILLASAALMVNYVETMLVPALPTLVSFFDGVPYTTIAWVVSAYLLVGVSTTPLFAKLGDIYGKKRMILVVLTVYSVAVALTGFSPQVAASFGVGRSSAVYLLIALRGLQGVGLALFPLAFAMVGEELPPARVGQAQGLIAAMFAIGAALGLFAGAWLIQTFGWQDAYHTVIPVALAILGLAAWRLPESRHRLAVELDVPGAALLGGALAAFLVALSQGPAWGWGQLSAVRFGPLPLGVPQFLGLSAVLLVLFYRQERRSAAPMIYLERFRERNLVLSYFTILLVGAALFVGFVGITIIVETPIVGLGQSVFQFGVLSLPTTMSMLAAAPFVGRAISRFGPKPMVLVGAALSTAGFLLLLFFNRTYDELLLAPIPTFVGLVTMIVSVTNVVVLSSRKGETGIQTGMAEMFQDLGASIGPVVVATILASFTGTFLYTVGTPKGPAVGSTQLPTLAGFHWLFAIGAALTAACGLLAVFLRNYTFAEDGTRSEQQAEVSLPQPAGE
ncbi:MAG TPA: MFS transporter [Thermoplasmata archaeon]|nr:MFS transporter [Thermoplasmata archaeon]